MFESDKNNSRKWKNNRQWWKINRKDLFDLIDSMYEKREDSNG